MTLRRRTGNRFDTGVWPGFVDVMTALLLVLVFVLSIFMVIQFVLRDLVSGQDRELDNLTRQLGEIAQVLSLERSRAARLEDERGRLTAALATERDEVTRLGALAASLTEARDAAEARNTAFEAQVAGLLADMAAARNEIVGLTDRVARAEVERDAEAARAAETAEGLDEARATIAALEDAEARAISEREAMSLALARLRDEIDAEREQARRAAAERQALEALVAELRTDAETAQASLADTIETLARRDAALDAEAARAAELTARLEAEGAELLELRVTEAERNRLLLALQEQLTEEEQARALEAAAAAALRRRLEDADTELTAMTLALEEQRRRAEETLTLLAAAAAARDEATIERDVTAEELAAAREALTEREALLSVAERTLAQERDLSAEEARRVALLNAQATALRRQLSALQALLDDETVRRDDMQVQITNLGSELNAALARELALQRRDSAQQALEIARLEMERQSLEGRRSEFFSRIADAIGARPEISVVGDRFVFQSEVLFDPGSADLGPEGRAALDQFASLFDEVRDALPEELAWVLRVDGHTDDRPLSGGGRFADNWQLSQARALSVVRYLVNQQGFRPDRLAANGFGEWQPIDPADTPEARARNRRIELKLTER